MKYALSTTNKAISLHDKVLRREGIITNDSYTQIVKVIYCKPGFQFSSNNQQTIKKKNYQSNFGNHEVPVHRQHCKYVSQIAKSEYLGRLYFKLFHNTWVCIQLKEFHKTSDINLGDNITSVIPTGTPIRILCCNCDRKIVNGYRSMS